jgi:hypothetical protein
MKKITVIGSLCIAVVLASLVVTGWAAAAEFSADLKEQQGESVKTGKLFVKGAMYCIELVEEGKQIIVIVDPGTKTTTLVSAADKEYRELAIDDMTSVMNDPFQAYAYIKEMGEEASAGKETVGGRECEKFVVTMQDRDIMSKWVAADLGFPVKIIAHGPPDKVMELTNIVSGPVDVSKFKIPAGFTKWIDPETLPKEPPSWAGGISSAPVVAPPFERDMAAGDIVRITVTPGNSLKMKANSKTEAEAQVRVVPFKEGRPLKEDTWYNNFAQRGMSCDQRHETTAEADEFVVYAYEGEAAVAAKWQEMTEKTVKAGEEIRLKLSGFSNIPTRLVNLGEGESVAVVSFSQGGAALSEEDLGPVKWRTITIKAPNEVDNRTMSPKGDELVISVMAGTILIKLGQYESFDSWCQ